MMRSMFSAVSSLRAHQLKMDVIGNNIANVNTVGYKGSRVTFQEVFSQTLKGAGRAQEGGRGGTNPQQVGLGISVSSMDTFHIRGSVERTDYNTDLMINGDGFFIVSKTPDGSEKNYTRAGNFGLDVDGNLVTSEGYYVLGYEVDKDGKPIETLTPLKISKSETSAPKATESAIFEGNIDSRLETGESFTTIMKAYDSLGNSHNIEVQFTRADDGTTDIRTYNVNIVKVGTKEIPLDPANNNVTTISFNSSGKLVHPDGKVADENNKVTQSITIKDGANPTDPPEINGTGDGNFNGAKPLTIKLDFTNLTSYAAKNDAAVLKIDGYASGKLDDFSISPSGDIEAVFDNGDVKIIGKVMLANFKNSAGLLKTGSNMYRETSNSGEAMFGEPGMGSFGILNPGALEMSNVDLSKEFTDMITTQRGFQANSRIITTSDEMLQELVNMKR